MALDPTTILAQMNVLKTAFELVSWDDVASALKGVLISQGLDGNVTSYAINGRSVSKGDLMEMIKFAKQQALQDAGCEIVLVPAQLS